MEMSQWKLFLARGLSETVAGRNEATWDRDVELPKVALAYDSDLG
jgi:hypothetical protein